MLFSVDKLKGLEETSGIIHSWFEMGHKDMVQFVRAAAAKWLLTASYACTGRTEKLKRLRRGKTRKCLCISALR